MPCALGGLRVAATDTPGPGWVSSTHAPHRHNVPHPAEEPEAFRVTVILVQRILAMSARTSQSLSLEEVRRRLEVWATNLHTEARKRPLGSVALDLKLQFANLLMAIPEPRRGAGEVRDELARIVAVWRTPSAAGEPISPIL